MGGKQEFVAMQQLVKVQETLGSELCQALDPLTGKLKYGFMAERKQSTPREYAELREAKSLLSYLKYPDPTEDVRTDDLSWALKLVKALYAAEGYQEWLPLLDHAAQLLDIDLTREHPLPSGLGYRISNELQLMGYDVTAVPASALFAAA